MFFSISILTYFSKIFKKIIYNDIIDFIDKYDILYKYQFDFRWKHSTQHALIVLVDKITRAIDNGDIMIGVFLGLKKAFDTVNHAILLNILY